MSEQTQTIVLAGGCFWGLQKYFDQFDGITTVAGYANGESKNPTYQQVCQGSGHAEAVKITFDDSIQLAQILYAFFAVIDPTLLNRQGNDVGINYRTGIYTLNEQQLETAKTMLADLQKRYDKKLMVEAEPLENFYTAEEYHQKYLDVNPQGYCHIPRVLLTGHRLPSMEEVREVFPNV